MKKSSYVTFYGFDKKENLAKVSFDNETGLSCFDVIKTRTPITLVDAIAILAAEFKDEELKTHDKKKKKIKIEWNVRGENSEDVEDWVYIVDYENETSKETISFNLKEPAPDVYKIPLIDARAIMRLVLRGSDEFPRYNSISIH